MKNANWLQAACAALLLLTIAPLSFAVQTPADTTQQETQLDINNADAETIAMALEGVGMVKAREIVAYREMFGKFTSVDELLQVQGIGAATLERNRQRILIIDE